MCKFFTLKYLQNMQQTKDTRCQYKSEFSRVRKFIISAFDYRCQICGKESTILHVHHIDHNHNNNDIYNMLPLCKTCHINLHSGIQLKKLPLTPVISERLARLKYLLYK